MSKHLTEQRFVDFPIHENVIAALDSKGFEFCTPIQAKTAIMEGTYNPYA